MTISSATVLSVDLSLVVMTIWTTSSDISPELDSRCHRDGQKSRSTRKDRVGAFVEDCGDNYKQMASIARTSLSSSNRADTHGLPCIHLVTGEMLPSQWADHSQLSLENDDEEAATAAAMRLTGAHADGRSEKIGADTEQQSFHRDEHCVPRRSVRSLLEGYKEVPTLEDQMTILRILVNHGHGPLQAKLSTLKDGEVRPRFEYGCEKSFPAMTAKHAREQAREGQQHCRGHTSTWSCALTRRKCRACRARENTAGCR